MPALLIRGIYILGAGAAAAFGFRVGNNAAKGVQYLIAGAGAYFVLKFTKVLK